MRVLVTGHNGYIGTVMVPILQKAGHEVIGMDSNLFTACTFGEETDVIPAIKKDIRDVETADLEGFDAIIHLAGLSNDPLGNLNPDLTYEINHLASVRLAMLAKQVGVDRFIFSSSCSNYGAAGDNFLDETSPLNPITPYGISKMLVERDVTLLASDRFSPVFLRNATVYGVSPRLRFDVVLNNLVAWAFTTGKVYLKSDGTPWRPIIHVEDVSHAFLAALQAPKERVHNQAFNIGRTEENYRIRELAEIVVNSVPGSVLEYAPDAGPDKRCYRVDTSKVMREIPDFKPHWDAHQGVKELYAAYQKVGITLDEFEGPRYKRIDHLKMLMAQNKLDSNLRWLNDHSV
jgi:nucleoside-diphosphate-sugar epimerase